MVEAVDEQALDVGPARDGDDVVAATGRRVRYPSWSWSVMIMRWPYLKVLMFSGVYFVPKRRPRILTTFWTCVVGRSFRARRRRRVEWRAPSHKGAASGASRSLDSVRMASNSKKKPATTSSDGHESRRWREGASTRRDAEIAPVVNVS